MKPVWESCEPREEVLKGDLDDAIFAADFGDLIAGKARRVYGDPKIFFQNTHPAQQLCKVIQAVFERLATKAEGGAVVRLSTGFGGGKTHTLMAMWHLANNISDPAMGTDLLPAAGRPRSVKVAAVDASKAGTDVFQRCGSVKARSLWRTLASKLQGEKGLKAFASVDDPEKQPDASLVEGMFPSGPVLVLLDELVVYMRTLSERGQGNLLAFLNKLISAVAKRPQTALVVTDPGGARAYAGESARLGKEVSKAVADTEAAMDLSEILGRKFTDFDPIGGEAAKVIVRRLFKSVDQTAAQEVSAEYRNLYQRVTKESAGLLPTDAASANYAKRIVECFPFHPRLLDTAQDRLGAIQDFQKSRGVLRLFARITRDTWERQENLALITAGDLDWNSPRIQADLLQRLNRDRFKSAVSADIEKHAGELDGGAERGVHRRVASALLLESLPLESNSGLEPADLTLAVLRPDEAGPEPSEALERLVGFCWHTYPMPSGRGWQFRYEPNVIRLVEERASDIPVEDARDRVLDETRGYFSGMVFKPAPWPSNARQVPESAELQLVLCEDEKLARSVCEYIDATNPEAPMPRRFRNAIVAITAPSSAFDDAVQRARRLLAAESVERDYKHGEQGKMVREQLSRLKPEWLKQFRIQACRAFNLVVFPGGARAPMEPKYQVPEEEILKPARGQACLRRFLDEKRLIYQAGDALDTNRFLKDILPGATPVVGESGVWSAKALHERFLSAPGLRLVPDGGVVRQSLLKALSEGKIVIKTPDNRVYDASGCVEGEQGARRRVDKTLTTFRLEDDVLVALAGKPPATEWLKEDKPALDEAGKPIKPGVVPPPPPPVPQEVTAYSWEEAVKHASERPLMELHIIAGTPASAASLASLAQPFGADRIQLTVSAGGSLKDGGFANFKVDGVKLTHPVKPLQIAQTIFSSLTEGGEYEADLTLSFGKDGRRGMESILSDASDKATEEITIRARFGKP